MPEDPSPPKSIAEWIQTKIGAGLLTLVSALGLSIATIAREKLSAEQIVLAVAIPTAALVLLAWIFVGVASRQRAKIEALEAKVLSLERPPVVALPKSYSAEQDAMLIQLAKSSTRNGNITHQGTLAIIESLERAGLVSRHHNEFDAPWWELNAEGRRYLKDRGLI